MGKILDKFKELDRGVTVEEEAGRFGNANAEQGRAVNDFYATSGVRSDLDNFEPSLTRQEFAAECDINTIMEQYEKHGVVSHVNPRTPYYVDMSQTPSDLMSALDIMAKATESFMSLPASVRRNFDNDPAQFVEFAHDERNKDKMREWGLLAPEKVEDPPFKVEVVNPDPSPAPSTGVPQA